MSERPGHPARVDRATQRLVNLGKEAAVPEVEDQRLLVDDKELVEAHPWRIEAGGEAVDAVGDLDDGVVRVLGPLCWRAP